MQSHKKFPLLAIPSEASYFQLAKFSSLGGTDMLKVNWKVKAICRDYVGKENLKSSDPFLLLFDLSNYFNYLLLHRERLSSWKQALYRCWPKCNSSVEMNEPSDSCERSAIIELEKGLILFFPRVNSQFDSRFLFWLHHCSSGPGTLGCK